MKKILPIFFLIFVFCYSNEVTIPAHKKLVNGDFEQDLTVGWTKMTTGFSYSDAVDRENDLDADANYELILEKVSAGDIKLFQKVDISSTNLNFSVNVKLSALEYNTNASYWAAAAICLQYLDKNEGLLGETRIIYKSPHCPWKNSSTVHLIEAANSDSWQNYYFNLNKELKNVSGIKPAEIKKIQVMFLATSNGG